MEDVVFWPWDFFHPILVFWLFLMFLSFGMGLRWCLATFSSLVWLVVSDVLFSFARYSDIDKCSDLYNPCEGWPPSGADVVVLFVVGSLLVVLLRFIAPVVLRPSSTVFFGSSRFGWFHRAHAAALVCITGMYMGWMAMELVGPQKVILFEEHMDIQGKLTDPRQTFEVL